jgi:hypothetical protein
MWEELKSTGTENRLWLTCVGEGEVWEGHWIDGMEL